MLNRLLPLVLFLGGFVLVVGSTMLAAGNAVFNGILKQGNGSEQSAAVLAEFTQQETSAPSVAPEPVVTPAPTITPTPAPVPVSHGDLWTIINNHRRDIEKNELSWYGGLCDYANKRKDVISSGSHTGFMQDDWQAYCANCTYMAENIARGYSDTEAIFNAWMGSSAHKQNIEGDWLYGCIAYFDNNVVAAEFGR